ncbi:unnamed protein product [Linum trigynum]|uniref:Uncharacterized protein n=1 Tax=Linum trigynum TaxID=586398 RepID=A0AAV2CXL5_9ROSI
MNTLDVIRILKVRTNEIGKVNSNKLPTFLLEDGMEPVFSRAFSPFMSPTVALISSWLGNTLNLARKLPLIVGKSSGMVGLAWFSFLV